MVSNQNCWDYTVGTRDVRELAMNGKGKGQREEGKEDDDQVALEKKEPDHLDHNPIGRVLAKQKTLEVEQQQLGENAKISKSFCILKIFSCIFILFLDFEIPENHTYNKQNNTFNLSYAGNSSIADGCINQSLNESV